MPMRRLSFLPPPPPAQDHIPGPAAPPTSSSSTSRRGGEKERLPPQRRRTTMAIGNRKDAEGLLASLRRFSLDSPMESQQENTSDYNAVADFQEVFHQLKLENPTASMGALQHKTMERIAARKEEERRMREELEKKEEDERLRNQSAAEKYVHRLVGKLLPLQDQHQHGGSNASLSKLLQQYPSQHQLHNTNNRQVAPQDESTPYRNNSNNSNNSNTYEDGKSALPFLSVPTGMRVSMITKHAATTATATKSSTTIAPRRASSVLIDIPWANKARRRSSADSSSNDNNIDITATNLAPRREDSQSVLSYRSNGSGGIQQLSISDDEISLLSGQSVGLYIEEDAFDPTSDPKATDAAATTTTTSLVDEQRQTRNHEGEDHWEGALTQMLIPNHLPSTEEKNIVVAAAITRDDAAASSSSELSLGHKSNSSFSTSSIMTNSSCFDGLIVGFRDRRASASATDHAADDDASEDDLIVGFVDRHAIANRDSRVK